MHASRILVCLLLFSSVTQSFGGRNSAPASNFSIVSNVIVPMAVSVAVLAAKEWWTHSRSTHKKVQPDEKIIQLTIDSPEALGAVTMVRDNLQIDIAEHDQVIGNIAMKFNLTHIDRILQACRENPNNCDVYVQPLQEALEKLRYEAAKKAVRNEERFVLDKKIAASSKYKKEPNEKKTDITS